MISILMVIFLNKQKFDFLKEDLITPTKDVLAKDTLPKQPLDKKEDYGENPKIEFDKKIEFNSNMNNLQTDHNPPLSLGVKWNFDGVMTQESQIVTNIIRKDDLFFDMPESKPGENRKDELTLDEEDDQFEDFQAGQTNNKSKESKNIQEIETIPDQSQAQAQAQGEKNSNKIEINFDFDVSTNNFVHQPPLQKIGLQFFKHRELIIKI